MRRKPTFITAFAVTAFAFGLVPPAVANADAPEVSGNVKGLRSGELGKAQFKASGSPAAASGTFSHTDTSGTTFTGVVTCLYRDGNRAVMTGPIDGDPTESLVLWVQDEPDAFDAAITIPEAAADCQNNFPLDRFSNPRVHLYTVTQGQIKIR